MPDPTVTPLASGSSALATTTVNFTAQPAGALLVLAIISDDYRTTSGAGRPESTGWTLPTGASEQNNTGGYLWYTIATGSETSVQYTIGSASHSAYVVFAASNIDQTTPFDIAANNFKNSFQADWTTPAAVASAGRRFAVGVVGGSTSGNDTSGVAGWTNSYVEAGDGNGQTSPRMECAAATLTYTADGVASTSTTGTFDTNGPGNIGGLTAVFRVATGGGVSAATPQPVNATGFAVQRAASW